MTDILNLDSSKATLVKDIPNDTMKFSVGIHFFATEIINLSFENGCFLNDLKFATGYIWATFIDLSETFDLTNWLTDWLTDWQQAGKPVRRSCGQSVSRSVSQSGRQAGKQAASQPASHSVSQSEVIKLFRFLMDLIAIWYRGVKYIT